VLRTFTTLYSGTTIGAMALAVFLGKAAGWRVIGVVGALYGAVYLYERLTWTNTARERAFKRQYVDYASSKLRLIVDLTSANCGHQVQQELNGTFARLMHDVDLSKSDLHRELDRLQELITQLDTHASRVHILKNKAQYIETELDKFFAQFLKTPESRL
jgi:mitofusin